MVALGRYIDSFILTMWYVNLTRVKNIDFAIDMFYINYVVCKWEEVL